MANDTSDVGGLQNQLENHYDTFIVSFRPSFLSVLFFLLYESPRLSVQFVRYVFWDAVYGSICLTRGEWMDTYVHTYHLRSEIRHAEYLSFFYPFSSLPSPTRNPVLLDPERNDSAWFSHLLT